MSENQTETRDQGISLSDHELLIRLARQQKTAMIHRRIIAYVEVLILALLVAGMLIVGPRLITLADNMGNTLERINTLIDKSEPAVESLSQIDYESLGTSIDTLTESVDQFSGFLNSFSKISLGGLFH